MSDRLLTISGPSLPDRTLGYLGTPYTNFDEGIELAFREAARIAAALLRAGVEVYSPIAHSHPLSLYGDIDALDRDFWIKYQENFMSRCDVLIVAEMRGWKDSIGIAHEIAFFLRARKTIFQLDTVDMNMRRMIFSGAEMNGAT